jgi:CheY-like chemotaxis protein
MLPATSPADILVIDDDPDVRHCLSLMLGWAGYTVATAADGRRGLEYLWAGARPRLIVLDLSMPVMDGWEFLARLRHAPHLRNVPVVAFSGLVDAEQPAAQDPDVAAVLPKPCGRAQLLDVARRFAPPPVPVFVPTLGTCATV